jgi:hypothetical protein
MHLAALTKRGVVARIGSERERSARMPVSSGPFGKRRLTDGVRHHAEIEWQVTGLLAENDQALTAPEPVYSPACSQPGASGARGRSRAPPAVIDP